MCVSIAKLSPNIKCTTICSEYYYGLQSSNPLFNSSTLFSFLRAYRSLSEKLSLNSSERFNKNSKESFTKISKEQAAAMKLCTNKLCTNKPFRKHTLCPP